MVRRLGCVVLLSGLVACTRVTPVESLAPYLARADRLRLHSGERVRVDRIIAQDVDSVTVSSEQAVRRIALDDVVAVEDRDRWRGFLTGAAAGAVVGLGGGVATSVVMWNQCSQDDGVYDPNQDNEEGWCELEILLVAGVAVPAAALLIGAIGGAMGAGQGHTDVFLRELPITVAPTRDGVSALWTIEF